MEIITSFTALNLEPGNLPKEASQLRQGDFQSVLKALQDAYCNTASDPDAYSLFPEKNSTSYTLMPSS